MSTTTASKVDPGGAARRTRVILAIILVSYFMILLDNSVIFTGLTKIQSSLGFSSSGHRHGCRCQAGFGPGSAAAVSPRPTVDA